MTSSRPPDADRTEPYLESLDSSSPGRVVALEWARYLVDTFGMAGAIRALQYYEDVHWISPSVRRAMVDHVQSCSPEDLDGREGQPEEGESLDGTPFEEHARSLEYVAAIADDSIAAELQPLRLPATGEASARERPGTADATDPATGSVEPELATGPATAEQSAASSSAQDAATPEQDAATATPGQDAATDSERVGVAGSPEDAETFHLLSEKGGRSRCGMLDSDSETTPDVGETLPRDAASEAGLSPCGLCEDGSAE